MQEVCRLCSWPFGVGDGGPSGSGTGGPLAELAPGSRSPRAREERGRGSVVLGGAAWRGGVGFGWRGRGGAVVSVRSARWRPAASTATGSAADRRTSAGVGFVWAARQAGRLAGAEGRAPRVPLKGGDVTGAEQAATEAPDARVP